MEYIKATELRLGNLVGFYKPGNPDLQYGYVDGVYLDDEDNKYKISVPAFGKTHLTEKGITSIPLAEERLARFGFKYSNQYGGWYIPLSDTTKLVIDLDTNKVYLSNVYLNMLRILEFMHELQNLYFTLRGEELKEIEGPYRYAKNLSFVSEDQEQREYDHRASM